MDTDGRSTIALRLHITRRGTKHGHQTRTGRLATVGGESRPIATFPRAEQAHKALTSQK